MGSPKVQTLHPGSSVPRGNGGVGRAGSGWGGVGRAGLGRNNVWHFFAKRCMSAGTVFSLHGLSSLTVYIPLFSDAGVVIRWR